RIEEGKEQSAVEVVVASGADQPGGAQLVAREPLVGGLAGEGRSAERKAEPKLAADRLAETTSCEVVARERAGGRVPQVPLVERRSSLQEREKPVATATASILLRRELFVLDSNVEPIGEPLDCAGEVQLLRLAHEGDEIAFRTATEAVVELVSRVDGE